MAENTNEQLKRWRNMHRLTQAEVANMIGASRGQYSNWESGLAQVPTKFLDAIIAVGFEPASAALGTLGSFSASHRIRATPGQLRVLIDVIADCQIREDIRENARQELLSALGLSSAPDPD